MQIAADECRQYDRRRALSQALAWPGSNANCIVTPEVRRGVRIDSSADLGMTVGARSQAVSQLLANRERAITISP